MTRARDIQLTPREETLLRQIDFRRLDFDSTRASLMPMMTLTELLLKRNAIPEVRLLYYTEAERYPKGRGLSREERFAENGTSPEEAHVEESFLPRLRYYIFGPDLPDEAFKLIQNASARTGRLARSDMSDVLQDLKKVVQDRGLDPHVAAEELHKLALEYEALPETAADLRKSIRAVRLSTSRG